MEKYNLQKMVATYSDNSLSQNCFGGYNSNCLIYPYPSYIYVDKTKKAIDILRVLEAKKLLEFKSVTKFLELVEEVSKMV